jgi:hypothetical protein
MQVITLPREHAAWPSGKGRLDDRVKFQHYPSEPWLAGTITEIGVVDATRQHLLLEVTLDDGTEELIYPEGAYQERLLIFPQAGELQKTDPQGALQRLAQLQTLEIARQLAESDEPVYTLVDPNNEYLPVLATRTTVDLAACDIRSGHIAVGTWHAGSARYRLGNMDVTPEIARALGLPKEFLPRP